MRCEDFVGLLIEYIEGSMQPRLREEFKRHIDDCSSCLAFVETYEKTKELTSELTCTDIPADLKERIKTFLRKKI